MDKERAFQSFQSIDLVPAPVGACAFCNLTTEVENGEMLVYCERCAIRAHIGCVLHSVVDCVTDEIMCKQCGQRAGTKFDKRNPTRFLSSVFFLLRRTRSILLWTPLILGVIVLLGYILRVSTTSSQDYPDFWLPSSTDFLIGIVILPVVGLVIGLGKSQAIRGFMCGCCMWCCCRNHRLVRRH